MTETWIPGVTRLSGPARKQGYPGVSRRELTDIEGEVKHSVEGSTRAALGVLAGPRQASWHFTVGFDETLQHYPLESICWHAGLPGDRRTDTSLIGNLALIGIEHSGGGPNNPGEPLTPYQVDATINLTREIRRLCPKVGAPELRKNLWEHGWISPTSCPSGRIPWDTIIAQEEDTMAPLRFIQAPGDQEWVTDGVWKLGITDQKIKTDLVNLGLAEAGTRPVAKAFVNWLRDYPADIISLHKAIASVSAAGGATVAEFAEVLDNTVLKVQR